MVNNEAIYAFAGKILRVNLSNGQISTEPTSDYAREWLGSTGIAIKMLYDELKPWVTPYEPSNKIIFGAGEPTCRPPDRERIHPVRVAGQGSGDTLLGPENLQQPGAGLRHREQGGIPFRVSGAHCRA